MAKESILNDKSIAFLEKYLNNAAPTGYEWEGQKIWMDYLKPYVDTLLVISNDKLRHQFGNLKMK